MTELEQGPGPGRGPDVTWGTRQAKKEVRARESIWGDDLTADHQADGVPQASVPDSGNEAGRVEQENQDTKYSSRGLNFSKGDHLPY